MLIYLSYREGDAKVDFCWSFTFGKSEPLLVTQKSLSEFRQLFPNIDQKIMVFNGIKFAADENVRPFREPDGNFYLKVYDEKFPCFTNLDVFSNSKHNPLIILIEPRRKIISHFLLFIFLANYFEQPAELIRPINIYSNNDACVDVCLQIDSSPGSSSDFLSLRLKINIWKNYIENNFRVKTLHWLNPDPYSRDKSYRIDLCPGIISNHQILAYVDEKQTIFDINNFMKIKVELEPQTQLGLYQSFKALLTVVGRYQGRILEDQLIQYSRLVQTEENFYAPFTSIVQSSGSGKSKLCIELLQKYPGMFLVFRKPGENGIPNQSKWMEAFSNFIFSAPKDDLPIDINELVLSRAIGYSPGRFLIALNSILKKYKELFDIEIAKTQDRNEAIANLGRRFMEDPKSSNYQDFYKFQDDLISNLELKHRETLIKDLLKEITEFLCPSVRDDSSPMGFMCGTNHSWNFPFLLFFDEADNLNLLTAKNRLFGVNVIRRGLHLLPAEARIMVVAIGTNSDVLDFTPSVRNNSLRFIRKIRLLPPISVTGNWNVLSAEFPFENVPVNAETLLNLAMFNILVSAGRPLWSSCPLEKVVSIAEAKLKNRDPLSYGALFALLMVRANHNINSHHSISRTLVSSYMATVNYVSSDGNDMKISYSSEPVLAMAARNLLLRDNTRTLAIAAMKILLERQALDKGRIVEAIFEHFSLFAIDDAKSESISVSNPNVFPREFLPLLKCENYLFELYKRSSQEPETLVEVATDSRPSNYRIVKVRNYLKSLLKEKVLGLNNEVSYNYESCDEIFKFISPKVLDAYMNATHFITLERVKSEYFQNLMPNEEIKDFGCNVIDKALLRVALLFQFAIVMPPNYPGIDFIIPILIKGEGGQENNDIYSFIAIQSKASTTLTVNDCAAKMNPKLHLVQCPIHESCADNSDCRAKFTKAEVDEIMSNSLVIIKKFEGQCKFDGNSKINCSKHSRLRFSDDLTRVLRDKFKFEPVNFFSDGSSGINYVKYPKFANEIPENVRPHLILSKVVRSDLSVHRLFSIDRTSITCIAIHNVNVMSSLLSNVGMDEVKKIVNFNSSVFDNIDNFHYRSVQNSVLHGSFCPFPVVNPILRKLRGLNVLPNPLPKNLEKNVHTDNFNDFDMEVSIRKCIYGEDYDSFAVQGAVPRPSFNNLSPSNKPSSQMMDID